MEAPTFADWPVPPQSQLGSRVPCKHPKPKTLNRPETGNFPGASQVRKQGNPKPRIVDNPRLYPWVSLHSHVLCPRISLYNPILCLWVSLYHPIFYSRVSLYHPILYPWVSIYSPILCPWVQAWGQDGKSCQVSIGLNVWLGISAPDFYRL